MIETLQRALAANTAISSFALKPGPAGCVAGVVCAPMSSLRAGAYVVPHNKLGSSRLGVRMELEQAGALAGFREYDGYLSRLNGVELQWGDSFVTDSGGGLSRQLIHLAVLGSGRELQEQAREMGRTRRRGSGGEGVEQRAMERERSTVEYATIASLFEARHRRIESLVFPPLCTGMSGMLSAEISARTIFGALHAYWHKEDPGWPTTVYVAVMENGGSYRRFEEVLQEVFGRGPQVQEPAHEKETIAPQPERRFFDEPVKREGDAPAMERVMDVLGSLSDLELASLTIASSFMGGNLRGLCTDHPWFSKVSGLFADNGSLHDIVREGLKREAARR